ncbi:MAG: SipW-dependent-type signal peptide-containing protein [Bacilli bacterium]|nr:SipW-dependent-type signal peptide-containing protein [Bacilli bacterium]
MEKKNTILLTVIAVATLLVAVVGATFAYFTASSSINNENGGNTQTSTPTSIGENLIELTVLDKNADVAYPGGFMVVGLGAEASTTGSNTLDASFSLTGEIDTTGFSTNTQIKWTVYELADPVTGVAVSGCEIEETTDATDATIKHYAYKAGSCSVNSTITEGKVIGSGTIGNGASVAHGKNAITATPTKLESVTSTDSKSAAYYLVVEYVNNTTAEQDDDQGKTISAKLTTVENAVFTTHAGA